MPTYLFTYHAHGSWLPDHPRGYVHRQRGLQHTDANLAAAYRVNQTQAAVEFDATQQQLIVDTARQTADHLDAIVHTVFTEPTHAHVLVSWQHDRSFKSMRTAIRSALSRALNAACGKRDWFSDSPSRKRVRDHDRFDHLVLTYSTKHHGAVWRNPETLSSARRRETERRRS